MTSTLLFSPLADFAPGTLRQLLSESYASLVESDPEHWLAEQKSWREYDAEASGNPQTVGACVFITTDAGEPVGFASWDPRQAPETGIIGHNCVVPDRQGQGIGTSQVREVLRRLRVSGIRSAVVTTGEHPFFLPARRMYLRCGFRETRRYAGGPDPRWRLVDYALDLHRA